MQCPICGGDSRVLDTRAAPFFIVRRRRECETYGHRFSTVELHSGAVSHWHVRQKAKGIAQRIATTTRDLEIFSRLHENEGRKNRLGELFGLDKSSVYRAARRGRDLERAKRQPPPLP